MKWMMMGLVLSVACAASAQDPSVDLQSLKALAATSERKEAAVEVTPTRKAEDPLIQAAKQREEDTDRTRREEQALDLELRELRKRDAGVRRFGADLFEFRQRGGAQTDGGIAEDYVLGTGDRLNLNVFGSATFDLPVQVDGRGEVVIPKVGTVKVGGKTLGQARSAIHGLVSQNFSRTTVDLQVLRLREVRVFVLGEVYRPGSYLVPSLSSLVNILSQAGGPTALGSYRQIRVMRGGKVVHIVDLYPLRAEGLGNLNLSFQNGDTLFVPLAGVQVQLEGGFVRVQGMEGGAPSATSLRAVGIGPAVRERTEPKDEPRPDTDPLKVKEREAQAKEKALWVKDVDPLRDPLVDRVPSAMWFELLPQETALTALTLAGGLAPNAHAGSLTLRRKDAQGVIGVKDLPMENLGQVTLQRGDVLSALPRRDSVARVVTVTGWVRVPGIFARTEGLRVGDLLKRDGQALPDTYLERGEIVRSLPDGSSRFLSFHLGKALAGDPAQNLALEDRDRVELFRLDRLRLPKEVSISGPLAKPGRFEFHEGMRASDLLFRAGVPQKSANRLVAELARSRQGGPSEVRPLDLGRLLSTEQSSPVDLQDEALNPRLREDDQISIFEQPEFRVHRTVRIAGQVARPGAYALDADKATLTQLIQRAGGLTSQAMPGAGIFLRRLGAADTALREGAGATGVDDPTAKGIDDILERLSEKKLVVEKTGATAGVANLLRLPIFHGLATAKLNRMVVDFGAAFAGKAEADVELLDGDEIIIPRQTDSALVIGEAASPFAFYKVQAGMKVRELLKLAGGTTRNADTWNIRLLKANGRIVDSWVSGQKVEPGDALLIPQKVRRDTNWQENLQALTPLALILNAVK